MRGLYELEEVSEQLTTTSQNNLMIVDLFNLAFRFKHRGSYDFAAEMVSLIRSLAKSYGAKKIIAVSDWKHSSFRKEIHPEYKDRGDRYDNQTDEEKEAIQAFFEGFDRTLELVGSIFDLLRFKYVEADDLAAYLVKNISHKFDHTWLISSDKDWDLLVSENVSRFSFVTRKEYTHENFYEEHGCDDAAQYISVKVLKGDSGDNVKGVERVGDKIAYGLLRQYGTAWDIWDMIPNVPGHQKYIARINESGNLIVDNYMLMDLLEYCEQAIAHPDQENLETMRKYCESI